MSLRSQIRTRILQVLGNLLPSQSGSNPSPQRIVVIEPGHLGDVLLLTPALTALRLAFPNAFIALLIGPWGQRLVAENPDLDAVLTCPFPGFVRGQTLQLWEPYRMLWKYAAMLRAGSFDTALVARDDHWWGGLLAAWAGIPSRVGMAHPALAPFLSTALPYDPTAHVTQQRLELVTALSHQVIPSTTQRFMLSVADRAWASASLARISPTRPLIALQPGSGGPAKLWPTMAWVELAATLERHATLVLTGGVADADVIRPISQALTERGISHEAIVGEADLGQLAALFARCVLVLGVDNGPLHLAVAQGTPTIHLFGPGDAKRFGPWGDPNQHRIVREPLWCAPCGVLSHCPRQTAPSECMVLISPRQVATLALEMLVTADDPRKSPFA